MSANNTETRRATSSGMSAIGRTLSGLPRREILKHASIGGYVEEGVAVAHLAAVHHGFAIKVDRKPEIRASLESMGLSPEIVAL